MGDAVKDCEAKMKKAIEATQGNFATLRTGRANPALLNNIMVEYYGAPCPLKQLASISVPEARQLLVQPFDKNAVSDIEKAIMKSSLGITPKTESGVIRLMMPQLTEERRKELVKQVKKFAEDGKVSLRNVRRDAIDAVKKAGHSEDEVKFKEEDIQKLITKLSQEIDHLASKKESEILEV